MTKWIFVFVIMFLASVDDINGLRDTATNKLPEQAAFNHLPSSGMSGNLPSVEESLKEICNKNGNSKSFDNATALVSGYTKDIVRKAHKYCGRHWISHQLTYCVSNFIAAIEPCLDEKEKDMKKVINNVTDALLSFACFKEGERIELFIAEGGPECFMDHVDEILDCVDSTFSKYKPKDVKAKYVPSYKLDKSECRDVYTFRKCVITELKKCKNPTPVNFINGLFNSIIKETLCSKYPPVSAASLFTGNSSFCILLIFVLHILLNLVYKF